MVRMAAWVALLSILIRSISLPRALQTVAPRPSSDLQRADPDAKLRLARAIDLLLAADVLCFRPSCWKRAIVLHRYLALQGIQTKIKFGVRKEVDGEMKGHAWLEHEGNPILESEAPNYYTTYTFPGAPDAGSESLVLPGAYLG